MYFFTPGPSQLYPTVASHLEQGFIENIFSISHRSAEFESLFKSTVTELKKLLGIPEEYSIFFISSATEAMERIIQNAVETKSTHMVTGDFGERFYSIASDLHRDAQKISLAELSNAKLFDKTELICFTHNESSIGQSLPLEFVYEFVKLHPEILVALDIVSSTPYVRVDYSKIDYAFFSIQKGFGLPAGLGVLITSPRALVKSKELEKKGLSTGSYRRFSELHHYANKNQTSETPNVLALYLLRAVAREMNEEGIDILRRETEEKATLIYNFFDSHTDFFVPIKDGVFRSQTLLVIESKNNNTKELVKKMSKEGFVVGLGYGAFKDSQIRIANYPAHTVSQVKKLLSLL